MNQLYTILEEAPSTSTECVWAIWFLWKVQRPCVKVSGVGTGCNGTVYCLST
ncbi:hypothetical protein SRABI96_00841 [Peribacillus sp. Bi96]|nr:hypothetical protein SRABI96_00841 [Peribacillus sp. Bi96]